MSSSRERFTFPAIRKPGSILLRRQRGPRLTDSRGFDFGFLKLLDVRFVVGVALFVGIAALSGCATVKPWQRDSLSLTGMGVDPTPLISSCDDHIYFSREASKGGRGFGGGGCGCD